MKKNLLVGIVLFFVIIFAYVSAQIPQPTFEQNPIINSYVFGILPSPLPLGLPAACYGQGPAGCYESDGGIDYTTSGTYSITAYDLNSNAIYCSSNFLDFCDPINPAIMHEFVCGGSIGSQWASYGGYLVVDCSILSAGGYCASQFVNSNPFGVSFIGAKCAIASPDLVVTAINVIGNSPLSVYVTLANLGSLPTGLSTTWLYSPFPPGSPETVNVPTPAISPGQYVTLGPVTFTASVPTGTSGFTMIGNADYFNQVAEGSESNNFLYATVSV